jgi:5-methylcytosine-specific restriction endonuclease McrA
MSDVLVLNASYEPLARVSWERAMRLVVADKAVIDEAEPDKFVRHKNGKFPWPKIIRLVRYVKIKFLYGEVPFSKAGVLKRDNYLCAYCNKKANTIDHIFPVSRGGEVRDWMNVVASCYPCNSRKDARTPEEAHMELLFQPFIPKGVRRRQ